MFATPYRVTWDYYFLSREHTLEIKEWEGKAEFEYVCHWRFLVVHASGISLICGLGFANSVSWNSG